MAVSAGVGVGFGATGAAPDFTVPGCVDMGLVAGFGAALAADCRMSKELVVKVSAIVRKKNLSIIKNIARSVFCVQYKSTTRPYNL